jgi:ribonuclease PH
MEVDFISYPEGSVLISLGKTQVLCNVSIEEGVPAWLEDRLPASGWITAEYALLPRSTRTRVSREKGGFSGRAQEISRMIGRSLRAGYQLTELGKLTCIVDCDVLQADGGTRTAAVTGGYLALRLALEDRLASGEISPAVFLPPVAAISVGMVDQKPMLDLCYREDAAADADLNIVMNREGRYIEIQGTSEGSPFTSEELDTMLSYASGGIGLLLEEQQQVLAGR